MIRKYYQYQKYQHFDEKPLEVEINTTYFGWLVSLSWYYGIYNGFKDVFRKTINKLVHTD